MSTPAAIIDVIIPVYGGYDETRNCIESVLAHPQIRTRCNLIIINDCSPEPAIHDYLNSFPDTSDVTILTNEENLGFVGTVNRGMSLNPDHDVLLLNSDTLVHGDWLDRIWAHYEKDPSIGTITPFSNNATICSFPNTCEDNELPFGLQLADIDNAFAATGKDIVFDVPTGVGFCMFISREALNRSGLFDIEAFGKGYGEENDFCMKTSKAGLRNVLCGDTFVMHVGHVSFASGHNEKVNRAQQILDKRYPEYHGLVQEHIQRNEARALRLSTLLNLIRNDSRPVILHIGHGVGGGVQHHIDSLRAATEAQTLSLELKPVAEGKLRLDAGHPAFTDHWIFDINTQQADLISVLQMLNISRVHFHHMMNVATDLFNLPEHLNAEGYFTLHDYYCFNGNPTLTDDKARFCNMTDKAERDKQCRTNWPFPWDMEPEQWRAHCNQLLKKMDRIIAPAIDCQQRFNTDFPELEILATPHEDFSFSQPDLSGEKATFGPDRLKVLVLGAISREKGADLIEACAQQLRQQNAAVDIQLLGYAYRELDSNAVETLGAYKAEALQDHIKEQNPDLIWLPAQWPETYSYTLSAAFESGRPVAVTDLGAPAERVSGSSKAWVLSYESDAQIWSQFFTDLQSGNTESTDTYLASRHEATRYTETDFYQQDYCSSLKQRPVDQTEATAFSTELLLHHGFGSEVQRPATGREQLLKALYKLYTHPAARPLVRLIPYKLLRAVKRMLSRRAIHDVVN